MKVNYGNYASEQLQSERRKLHRKLILPNIFILLISLAAAVSLLFGQLLSSKTIRLLVQGRRCRRDRFRAAF